MYFKLNITQASKFPQKFVADMKVLHLSLINY